MTAKDSFQKAYGIVLCFDAEAEASIEEMCETLRGAGIPAISNDGHMRPHVTLAVCGELDVPQLRARLEEFAAELAPFPIAFSSLGIFTRPSPVLYLAPRVTAELLTLNARMNDLIQPEQCSELYRPNAWAPHCSLTSGLEPDQIGAAVDACRAFELPLRARIETLGFYALDPMRTIAVWRLGPHEESRGES